MCGHSSVDDLFRKVRDNALLLETIAGPDDLDIRQHRLRLIPGKPFNYTQVFP